MEPVPNTPPASQEKKGTAGKGFTVGIDANAHRHVTAQAKKLDVSKSEYASAAIAFFAQSGLDPTKELPTDLSAVSQKVEAGVASVRIHNADIGNRLYALTRSFERTTYQFMQQQESTMTRYLEGIESNVMKRLVLMEERLLRPLVERVLRGNQEAYINRGIGILIYQMLAKDPPSWSDQNKIFTEEREELLEKELKDFLKSYPMPAAKSMQLP
ncbi:MAG: hypothetical protein EOO61_04465 [Hymenobacter sp.]|nr:MAG: hypothetical protein EOO61_04465 [Hymenobacter sp.]